MTLKGITFKKIISFLLISAITICVMPFNHIKADEVNYDYIINSSNDFTTPVYIYNAQSHRKGRIIVLTNEVNSNHQYFGVDFSNIGSNNVRVVYFKNSSTFQYLICSNVVLQYDSSGLYTNTSYNGGSFDRSYGSTTIDNKHVEWIRLSHGNSQGLSDSVQYMEKSANTSTDSSILNKIAWSVMYGAEEPAPPLQAGELKVNYYTDFASTQQYTIGALKSNKDTIKWEYDSTNSNISLLDLKVDIRAVPNNYYSSTETGLESLGWGDMHLDVSYAADLGSYQINNNQVSYTWESVVNSFKTHTNLPEWFDNVINFWSNGFYKFYNNQYYAAGWVYQIRLNTWSGDYVGEWQTIYTVPSSPPEGQQTTIEYYVNGTGMTEPVYQNIQNINNQNNITNNTWYVNGSPYGINDDSGENWFTKLLEILAGLVSDIISAITGLFGDVFSGMFDLIKSLGVDLLSVFTNLITWFRDLIGSIDLTGQNYILPEEYTQNINTFSSWTNGVLSILFNSGFGLIVLVPFVLFIVGLFL